MVQKTEQKAKGKRAVGISSDIEKHLEGIMEKHGSGTNKYGHLLGRPTGFIDGQLEQQKSVDEIVEAWAKQYPDKKPITRTRVVEQIKHLLAEHNFKAEVEKSQQAKPKKA